MKKFTKALCVLFTLIMTINVLAACDNDPLSRPALDGFNGYGWYTNIPTRNAWADDYYEWVQISGEASVVNDMFAMGYAFFAPDQATGDTVANQILDAVEEFGMLVSVDYSESQINKINSLAANTELEIDFYVFDMLRLSKEYKTLSGGYFDPAVYPLLEMWSLRSPNTTWHFPPDSIPTIAEVNAALEYCNLDLIEIYTREGKYYLKKSDSRVQVELGAISKGYIVDILRDVALSHGIRSGIISISGNVYLISGKGQQNEFWTVGLEPPRRESYFGDEYFATFYAANVSSVASGDYSFYYNYKYSDGEELRFPHIINPKTGMPLNIYYDAQSGRYKQATDGTVGTHIMGYSSAICDILSTATILMPMDKAYEFLEQVGSYNGILMTEDKKYTVFGKYFEFTPSSTSVKMHYKDYEFVDFKYSAEE